MRERRGWLGIGVGGAALAAAFAWVGLLGGSESAGPDGRNPPERVVAPGDGHSQRAPAVAAAPPRTEALDSELLRRARGPRPASLAGTDVDGGLSVDESGHFLPDPDALALFEYFLAATGEEPDAVIRQRIVDEIRARLEAPADAEAVAFLGRYLGYREAVRGLAEGGAVPHDLDRRMQWLRELRRTHFGADSEALFGLEEATVLVDLERRRVASDPTLSAAEKSQRLAALDAELPEPVREARRRASAPARVRAEVHRLRAEGAGAGQVFAAREEAFGTEAAERLARLDEDREAWRQRVGAYRVERDALFLELGLDPAEAVPESSLPAAERARLDVLRRSHFEDDELLRVEVLDRAR